MVYPSPARPKIPANAASMPSVGIIGRSITIAQREPMLGYHRSRRRDAQRLCLGRVWDIRDPPPRLPVHRSSSDGLAADRGEPISRLWLSIMGSSPPADCVVQIVRNVTVDHAKTSASLHHQKSDRLRNLHHSIDRARPSLQVHRRHRQDDLLGWADLDPFVSGYRA